MYSTPYLFASSTQLGVSQRAFAVDAKSYAIVAIATQRKPMIREVDVVRLSVILKQLGAIVKLPCCFCDSIFALYNLTLSGGGPNSRTYCVVQVGGVDRAVWRALVAVNHIEHRHQVSLP